jgi:hypothetical protein
MRLIAFQIGGRTLPVRGATSEFNLRTTLCHLSGKVGIAALVSVLAAFAQGPGPGAIGPGPGCNLLPAPPSVGATVDLSYFGPPPSESNPSLVGPLQLLRSGAVDSTKGTITLPLYRGSMKGSGKAVWYILTDVDDPQVATLLGLNYSAKLTFAANAARTAN